jgi:hypothetical protein
VIEKCSSDAVGKERRNNMSRQKTAKTRVGNKEETEKKEKNKKHSGIFLFVIVKIE